MFKLLFVIGLIVFLSNNYILGQDTIKPKQEVKQIDPVTITYVKQFQNQENNIQLLTRLDILKLQPQDVGALLQKVSGSNLKSYGGLGGMKTIAVRGLGGQHTGVVVDGFLLNNAQSGQINLATIQTDNIDNLTLNVGGRMNYLLPATAYTSGNVLTVSTFENAFDSTDFKIRFNSKVGSFGEIDNYLAIKKTSKKKLISAFGKYRQANGNYPFQFQNGINLEKGVRLNNDLKDWYSGINLAYKLNAKSIIRLMYKNNGANQGLPGAIIFYNSLSDQRLLTNLDVLNLNFNSKFKLINFRLYSSYQTDKTTYIDPSYLNSIGGLTSKYKNQSLQSGISFFRIINQKATVFGGIDSKYQQLDFFDSNSAQPKRIHTSFVFGTTLNLRQLKADIQLTGQSVSEQNNTGERASNQNRINPFILLESNELGSWRLKFNSWYKNSFRIPTFNELYYNGIGNVKLKPEDANQFSFGFQLQPKVKLERFKITSNGYYTTVKNQILAIPTKNLFVWSMQNIGQVHTLGAEIRFDLGVKINANLSLDINGNYTFQRSLDFSNQNSPTYKNQIAYTPVHSGNGMITFYRKNSGCIASMYNSSLRYSLNENINSNIIDGFFVADFGIFTKILKSKKQDLRLQFSVKNAFNSSYAFIQYYVMPGRSFLISFNYALH